MNQQLNDKIIQIFVNHLEKDINSLKGKASFSEIDLDELDIIEAIMRIEDEFCIEISDDEAEKLNSIFEIVTCVENKLANK